MSDYRNTRILFQGSAPQCSITAARVLEDICLALSNSDQDFLQLFDECAERIKATGGRDNFLSTLALTTLVLTLRAGRVLAETSMSSSHITVGGNHTSH